jgi:hypothetical protein
MKSEIDPDVWEPDNKEQDEQEPHHKAWHAVEEDRHRHRRVIEPTILVDRGKDA